MDFIRPKESKKFSKKYWWLIAAVVLVIITYSIRAKLSYSTMSVESDLLSYGQVSAGEFVVSVTGSGTLVPKRINLITTNVSGKVEEISKKAGDRVKVGDVIVSMINPDIEKLYTDSEFELEAKKSEDFATNLELESQILNLEAELLDSKLKYQTAKSKLDAESELVEQGFAVVSKLEFENSKTNVQLYLESIGTNENRLEIMKKTLEAKKKAQDARTKKLESTLEQIKRQIDGLQVKATSDGIVQQMDLELGQQVELGGDVAKVVQQDSLIAEINVQEIQVKDIALGQTVQIDTRSSKVEGKVSRIDPGVVNGMVQIDVEIVGKLPPEARSDLSVEGVIEIARKNNTVFVNRPVFAKGASSSFVYRVNQDSSGAERIPVRFGLVSTRFVEVIDGLRPGDSIIISDPTLFEDHDRIYIN